MFEISLPEYCNNEIRYTLDVVFGSFFVVEYTITPNVSEDIILTVTGSESRLTVRVPFFKNLHSSWLENSTMPELPLETWNPRKDKLMPKLVKNDLPILFGASGVQRKNGDMVLNLDVFGSIFFLLSRYEEMVNVESDNHNRFSFRSSIAFKADFLDRPLVDEYCEVLWKCIEELWSNQKRKSHTYEMKVTCDVDEAFSSPLRKVLSSFKYLALGVLRNHNILLSAKVCFRAIESVVRNSDCDYYEAIRWMMDVNEEAGNTMTFYFIVDNSGGGVDGFYSIDESKITNLIRNILDRGHYVGLHGSYDSYLDISQIRKEVSKLAQTLTKIGFSSAKIKNRQHFLRWETPKTAKYLEAAGVYIDSTLGYADSPGFRAGTCRKFKMYDLENRQGLELYQQPLIVMECSIISERYKGMGYSEDSLALFIYYQNVCKRYGGQFTLLWHNTYIDSNIAMDFYKKIVR